MTFESRRRFLVGSAAASAAALLPRLAVAAGMTLKDVKAMGELRVGVEATFVPFAFRREGKIVGYDADLAEIFARSLGVKPMLVDTQWAGVIPSLYAKKFDVIMSCLAYSKDRVEKVGYTIPYVEASQAMLIRASDTGKIRGPSDLNGKVLGVKLGSPGQFIQEKFQKDLKAAGGPGMKEVRMFDDHPSAYLALAQNRVDAVLNNIPTLSTVLKDAPGQYAMVTGIGADNWAGIATRKEDTEIIEFLNGEIKRLKADGTIYKLEDKWFGFKMNLIDHVPQYS